MCTRPVAAEACFEKAGLPVIIPAGMLRVLLLFGVFFTVCSNFTAGQQAWGGAYVSFDVANDVFVLPIKTDRYFTGGVRLEVGKVANGRAPFRINSNASRTSYWRFTQDIFTPSQIEASELLTNDRPFASYLTVSRGKTYGDDHIGLRLNTEWTAGILGKYSGGGMMQNAFHGMVDFADPLPGWKNEINTDLILNYRADLQTMVAGSQQARLFSRLQAQLGTLHIDIEPGLAFEWRAITLRPGRTLDVMLSADARLVGYNATLTGGLLNRDERFRGIIQTLPLVGTAGLDVVVTFDGLRLCGGLRQLSPEFKGGEGHGGYCGFRILPGWDAVTSARPNTRR